MLAELRISGNLIHSLPEFLFPVDDVTSYRRLDLSSNQLLAVPQVVREMTGLKYLVLSSNPVKVSQVGGWIFKFVFSWNG